MEIAVVIMAGGAGTRFWPASTQSRPKQLLRLLGTRSLLEESFERAARLVPADRILVLTNAAFVLSVREQLPALQAANVVGEPARRDTAAAVCLGALLCRRRFGKCVMVVLTADHLIAPAEEFERCVLSAARAAAESDTSLYTFGIPPAYAATGYGYLELGDTLLDDGGVRHHRLRSFHEKPDAKRAAAYVADGGYLWNSGMFAWRTDSIITAFGRFMPEYAAALEHAVSRDGTPEWHDALAAAFEPLVPVSVDVGILERAADVRTVEATFEWSDLGGWIALEGFLAVDEHGNHHRGRTAVLDARRNVVFTEDVDELVALIGVDDLVVVRAGRRTLVAHRDRVEEIKQLVQGLVETGCTEDL